MFASRFGGKRDRNEVGYVLLTLLLFFSLLIIAAGVAAPNLAFSIRRDREEELIHRGVQYRRAIRHFYQKTGRYPASLEELENTNGMRFLRKQYTDPITGKEFKLLRFADVQFSDGARTVIFAQNTAETSQESAGTEANTTPGPAIPGRNPSGQDDASSAQDENTEPAHAAKPVHSVDSDTASPDATALAGVGPIVGVSSQSKHRSIREFNHQSHYNDWQFYFDSGYDYGPITGPTVKSTMAIPTLSSNPAEAPKGD